MTKKELEHFLFDPKLLGVSRELIYPNVINSLVNIFTSRTSEVVLCGGAATGKTFTAHLALLAKIYELSEGATPQEKFNLPMNTPLTFIYASSMIDHHRETLHELVSNSVYFTKKTTHVLTGDKTKIVLPHNIEILFRTLDEARTPQTAINLVGGIVDIFEPTWAIVCDAVRKRIRSRTGGQRRHPGLLVRIDYDDVMRIDLGPERIQSI